MAFTFSSTSGTSGITNITVSATERLQTTNYSKNYTISNDNKSLGMAVAQKAYSPSAKYITISPSAITWSASESTGSITINSNDDWVVVSSGWIELSRMNDSRTSFNQLNSVSGNGNTIIGIRCNENTGSTRTGGITAYCQSDSSITATTTVSQAGGYEKPYIMLGYYSLEVVGNGVSTAVSVTSNVSWSATTDSRWIRLNTLTGTGNGSVSFVVDANTADIGRRGTVTVFNGELSVSLYISQAASSSKPYIILTPSQFIVEASGSSGNVISISANCDYDISADVNWITLSASSGSGNGSVSFTTNSTADKSANAGNIEFSNTAISRTVSVERQGTGYYLYANKNIVSATSSGGSFEILVYSNVNWSVRVDMGESELTDNWITVSPSSGSNDGSIRISVSSGMTYREGNVLISSSKYGLSWVIDIIEKAPVDGTKLFYTSIDGNVIDVVSNGWGANVISNTYSNGVGIVKFNGNVTKVPSYAFSDGSYRLKSLVIPPTVERIDENGINADEYFTAITLSSISGSGLNPIRALWSLKEIHFNGNAVEFANTWGGLMDYITTGYIHIFDSNGYDLYLDDVLARHIDLSDFQGDMVGREFSMCKSITGVTIGENITTIDGFYSATSLSYVNYKAVSGNTPYAMTENNVWNSFSGCPITRVDVGSRVLSLPVGLFYTGGETLVNIHSYATTAPKLWRRDTRWTSIFTGPSPFESAAQTGNLQYPSGSDYSTWFEDLPEGWS